MDIEIAQIASWFFGLKITQVEKQMMEEEDSKPRSNINSQSLRLKGFKLASTCYQNHQISQYIKLSALREISGGEKKINQL